MQISEWVATIRQDEEIAAHGQGPGAYIGIGDAVLLVDQPAIDRLIAALQDLKERQSK